MPSAEEVLSAKTKTGSSSEMFVEFTDVVVPLTVRLPPTVMLPEVVTVSEVESPRLTVPLTVKFLVTVASLVTDKS